MLVTLVPSHFPSSFWAELGSFAHQTDSQRPRDGTPTREHQGSTAVWS